MKLGIISAPEAESFEAARKLGLDFVEFDCNCASGMEIPQEQAEGNPRLDGKALLAKKRDFQKAIEATGVSIGAVGRWASRIFKPDGTIDQQEFDQVKALIQLCGELSVPNYLVSVVYLPKLTPLQNLNLAVNYLNQVTALAKDAGATVSIVNCPMGGNYIRKPELWRLILPEVPGLKIKYDPSHSFVHGGKNGAYLEESLEFADQFGFVHIKGVIQGEAYSEEQGDFLTRLSKVPELSAEALEKRSQLRRWYDNPPAGMDVIQWPAFFAALYKGGYDGMLSIEPHSPVWKDALGEKGVRFTIDYIRQFML